MSNTRIERIPAANVDVAINVFAKPWQTALSVLSLLKHSGKHISKIWLQYEPKGSKFDSISPYLIASYLKERKIVELELFQPDIWLDKTVLSREELSNPEKRAGIRFQHAFENSTAPFLFLTHNDVFVLKDIIGGLKKEMETAFSIGQLGQCWNCPAHHEVLTQEVMGVPHCTPERHQEFRPASDQLLGLYRKAEEEDIFSRPYHRDNFAGDFTVQPWPLPECRVNEWCNLINLEQVRKYCAPFGPDYPPGAYGECGGHSLDISVPFFRDLYARGLHAKHFDISKHIKHWIGTGNKSPARYAYSEDRARKIIEDHFEDFAQWARKY